MRRADAEMQQKIEALIQEESDPRERARLLILYQIASILIDNVAAVSESTKEFKQHRIEYDKHIEREEAFLNQGKGMWNLAGWIGGAFGIVLLAIQGTLGYLYSQHIDAQRRIEAVGTNGTDLVQNGVITSVSPILISELDTISTYLATGVASAVSDYSIPASIPIYGQGVTSYAPFLLFFTGYAQAQNTTRYLGGYNCNDAFTGAESEAQIPMPACTLKNLRVSSLTTFTAGQSTTFTVRKNGVDTGLTVTLDNTNQKFNNLANSITFAAGDLMSIKSVASATAGTKYYQATVEVQA